MKKEQRFLDMVRLLIVFLGQLKEGACDMKQKQFNGNKCNLLFVKLNTFNTHMKGQCYLSLGRRIIISLGNCTEGVNYIHETKSNFIATNGICHL